MASLLRSNGRHWGVFCAVISKFVPGAVGCAERALPPQAFFGSRPLQRSSKSPRAVYRDDSSAYWFLGGYW